MCQPVIEKELCGTAEHVSCARLCQKGRGTCIQAMITDNCDHPCSPGTMELADCETTAPRNLGLLCTCDFPPSADGIGDACDEDPDADGDGVPDACDNCPAFANSGQEAQLALDLGATFRSSGTNVAFAALDGAGTALVIVEDAVIETPTLTATVSGVTGSGQVPFDAPMPGKVCGDGIDNDCNGTPDDDCGFFDDMESGEGEWTHMILSGAGGCLSNDWQLSTDHSTNGQTIWWSGPSATCEGDAVLVSPVIPHAYSVSPALTFQHYYEFDYCADPWWEDLEGGLVEVSVDGGPFVQIFPAGGYSEVLASPCANPLNGYEAYAHDTGGSFVPAEFDLTPFAGSEVQIRFHVGWDCGNCQVMEGWFIDDVAVQ